VGRLKTAATVAVASAVHGWVQRRQQERWAALDQARAAAMPTPYTSAPAVAPVPPPSHRHPLHRHSSRLTWARGSPNWRSSVTCCKPTS
jgi:hypothetical protein